MENTLIEKFQDEITSIREYIKHINFIKEISIKYNKSNYKLIKVFNDHLNTNNFHTHKKVFEFKSSIITLYGILEKYINLWIKDHIDGLCNFFKKYENLPNIIINNNFKRSIMLITKIIHKNHSKYENLDREKILFQLNDSLKNNSVCSLNGEAFKPFEGNLKHSRIAEAFKPLGIDLTDKLKNNLKFRKFLEINHGTKISNKGNELFRKIDELVNYRNEISHGSEIVQILNNTELEIYIEFLEKYGKAIFEIIVEKEIQYEKESSYKKILHILKVLKKGTVLCFQIENTIIKIGDFIIVEASNKHIFKNTILDIQLNNKSFDKINISSKTEIALNLKERVTIKNTFYIRK